MSEIEALCDQVRHCTHRTIEEIRGREINPAVVAELLEARASHFSSIESIASDADVELLTQLSRDIQSLDAEILEWMQSQQLALAKSLRKVRNNAGTKPSPSPEPRILIQSA